MVTTQAMPLDPPLEGLQLKREFRDAYQRRAYARAWLLARRLLAEPRLVEVGRSHLERFSRPDPHQRSIYVMWREVLEHPVEDIVRAMLTDDDRGEVLRSTAPVFAVIPAAEVRALARSAA